MKKIILAVIISSIAFMNAESAPKDIESIKKRGTLLVAMTTGDQPPFYFTNKKGELDGLDVYISKRIAEKLEVAVEFDRSYASFNDTVDAVMQGKADIAVTKLSRTTARAQKVLYSAPYVTFRQAMLINRLQLAKYTSDDKTPAFIRKFKGSIGVIAGSSYEGYAKANFPGAEVVPFASWDAAVEAVDSGKVLAAYRDELEIQKIMDGRSGASLKLKMVIFKDMTDPIAIAVTSDGYNLVRFIDIVIEDMNLHLDATKILREYGNK